MARRKRRTVQYMRESWGTIVGIVLATGTLLAATYKGVTVTDDTLQQVDQNTEDILLVGERLDSKITQDNLNAVQQRQWALEDRYKGKVMQAPAPIRDEYRRLDKEKYELEKRLQQIEQQVQPKQKP
jgi:ribosomal protein S2